MISQEMFDLYVYFMLIFTDIINRFLKEKQIKRGLDCS